MEKSIENIWKEGFLKSDAYVVPKIHDLYNQKSIHITEKFKRMFHVNLIAIVVVSTLFLIVSFFMGMEVMGIIFFVTLMVHVFINKRLLNELNSLEKGKTSYQYLTTFHHWIKKQIATNKRISTFLYPIIFLSIVLGFWFKEVDGIFMGEKLVAKFLAHFPDAYLVFGIPLVGIIVIISIMGLFAFFGGRIFLWDMNVIYGRVIKKLNELLNDLESLRS